MLLNALLKVLRSSVRSCRVALMYLIVTSKVVGDSSERSLLSVLALDRFLKTCNCFPRSKLCSLSESLFGDLKSKFGRATLHYIMNCLPCPLSFEKAV